MKYFYMILCYCFFFLTSFVYAQTFPDSLLVSVQGGTFQMGESENDYQGPPGTYDAFLHTVTLSSFQVSATEISNQQYVEFLNAALGVGLIEVQFGTSPGPDQGATLVVGASGAADEYKGQVLINLSGTRVLKDHDNADGDNDPFTGVIEPENPLNICYIGYDETRQTGDWFYVKDPANPADFDWTELTNYYNYTTVTNQKDLTVLLNDYDNWEELADYPNNLPTVAQVKNWPATFIRWYGAKAYVLFYNLDLPTEAQWEYAAQGGAGYTYATADGMVNGDGTSANWNYMAAIPSQGHVLDVRINEPNGYGLYNLAGNVWEWVEDWYASDYYTNTEGATDPINTTASGYKVRRGGSWNYHLSTLKSAARARDEQFKGNDHFGFRVVKNGTETAANPQGDAFPKAYQLYQNYPNPFNPSTEISYTLSTFDFVTLFIYDMQGRNIKMLVNEYQNPGLYLVHFNAEPYASSIYFYRLQVGNHFKETKKMLLIR